MNTEQNNKTDLIIIGSGIMGLFTAYYAADFANNIVILEKSTIGNKLASSFSITRSMRVDYLDNLYAGLAYEAQVLWRELQSRSGEKFLIDCDCLNIAKKSVTPDLQNTYGKMSYQTISDMGFKPTQFSKQTLRKRFPQFSADAGYLDTTGGYFYLPTITRVLLSALRQKPNMQFVENVATKKITATKEAVQIQTDKGNFVANNLIITAGIWVNEILSLIERNKMQFPIKPYKPQERKYVYPSKEQISMFLPENFPVFAYLDIGIYGHPIFDREKNAIKISYYNPPDLGMPANPKINSVAEFTAECLPILKNAKSEDIQDADLCSYDLVKDDNFIIGNLPKFENIIVGAGWRGTGYKYAPLIGKILTQLALQKRTIYDISRFSPGRFTK